MPSSVTNDSILHSNRKAPSIQTFIAQKSPRRHLELNSPIFYLYSCRSTLAPTLVLEKSPKNVLHGFPSYGFSNRKQRRICHLKTFKLQSSKIGIRQFGLFFSHQAFIGIPSVVICTQSLSNSIFSAFFNWPQIFCIEHYSIFFNSTLFTLEVSTEQRFCESTLIFQSSSKS